MEIPVKQFAVCSTACNFLWVMCALYYDLSEIIEYRSVMNRSAKWTSHSENIGGWVIEEDANLWRTPELKNAKALFTLIEEKIEKYYSAFDRLVDAAKNRYTVDSRFSQDEYIYFYYTQWFLLTLFEFDRLIAEQNIPDSEFYQYYQEDIHLFVKLAILLGNDYPPDRETLQHLDKLLLELTAEWKQAILSVAEEFSVMVSEN